MSFTDNSPKITHQWTTAAWDLSRTLSRTGLGPLTWYQAVEAYEISSVSVCPRSIFRLGEDGSGNGSGIQWKANGKPWGLAASVQTFKGHSLLDGQNSVIFGWRQKMKSCLDQFGTFRCSPLHFLGGQQFLNPWTQDELSPALIKPSSTRTK